MNASKAVRILGILVAVFATTSLLLGVWQVIPMDTANRLFFSSAIVGLCGALIVNLLDDPTTRPTRTIEKMTDKYIYGGRVSEVQDASRVSGTLIKILDGTRDFAFRVYHGDGEFTDYDLNHDDLAVTIDKGFASFVLHPRRSTLPGS